MGKYSPRPGSEYFLRPLESPQRRYEALRAYFVEGQPAADVAQRFGYSVATVYQMASLLRTGQLELFTKVRRGPQEPFKVTAAVRGHILLLRMSSKSITEIAELLAAAGTPVSPQTVWHIVASEGMSRLPRRRGTPPGRSESHGLGR